MATTKPKKPAGPEGKGLKVLSKREGFRRAGHTFGSEPKVIPYADLDEDQVELLQGDPSLLVAEVDLPKEDESAATATSSKKK